MNDFLLAIWVVTSFLWDCLIIGGCSYVVFWKGRSGWWFVMTVFCCYSPSLLEALKKRFNITEEEEE